MRRDVFHIIMGDRGGEQQFSVMTIEALLALGVIKEATTSEIKTSQPDLVIEERFYKKA